MNTTFCVLCGNHINLRADEWVHTLTGMAYDPRPCPALGGGMLAGHYAEPPSRQQRAIQLPETEETT